MRHRKKGRKLGTDASHTKAMRKSLIAALLANDRIKTIEPRAKEIRGEVDRVITWAKRGDVHSRRLAIAKVGDKEVVREVFEKVAQGMFADRNGGYTRIYKLGSRKGDKAPMVIMELVTEPVSAKSAETKKTTAPKGAQAQKIAAEELNEKLKFDEEDEKSDDTQAEEISESVESTTEQEASSDEQAEEAEDTSEQTAEVSEDSDDSADDAESEESEKKDE